jgi:hypothetical protein
LEKVLYIIFIISEHILCWFVIFYNIFALSLMTTRRELISFKLSDKKIQEIIYYHLNKAFKFANILTFFKILLGISFLYK